MDDPAGLQGKTLLIINGCSPTKAFAFEIIYNLGVKIICMHTEKGSWIEEYVNEWIITDVYNHEIALNSLDKFTVNHSGMNIDGVLTFWEESVLLTSKITDILGLRGISYDITSKIKNKHEFRKVCISYGIPSVKSHMIQSKEDIVRIQDNMTLPFVLKPCFGASSTHTIKIDTIEQLKSAYNNIVKDKSTKDSVYLRDGVDFYVEEYLQGEEIDVDVLIQDGIIKFQNITDNDVGREPYFMELGFSGPTKESQDTQQQVFNIVNKTVLSFGLEDCCIHYEFKLTSRGPVPLEINMRMGGGNIYDLVKFLTNVDLVLGATKIALGVPLDINIKPINKYAISRIFLPYKSGRISKIAIPESINNNANIIDIKLFKKVGDTIFIPPEGYDNFDLGSIIIAGDTPEDVEAKTNKILKDIIIETE